MNLALIRADGSNKIGLGHLTRQIDIANELKKKDYEVVFLTKNYPEGVSKLKESQFEMIKLKEAEQNLPNSIIEINNILKAYKKNIDLIMVDLFQDFDNQDYLNILKNYCQKLFVLSDHPDPFYINVDAVFAISENQEFVDYNNLQTKYYTGLKYFPLNSLYENVPHKIIKKDVNNILITFGGSDPKNYSGRVIKILKKGKIEFKITLILGAGFSNAYYNELIKDIPKNVEIKVNIPNMIDYLIGTDLCLCSAGNTLIEALTCGVPCIVLPQTELENQRAMVMETKNMAINLNLNFSEEDVLSQLKNLIDSVATRQMFSNKAQSYLDGKGLRRIIEIIS